MRSEEEKVEDYFKRQLVELGIRSFTKNEPVNESIDTALKTALSKSGGTGRNYPDIKILYENDHARRIPVMVEIKGEAGKLEKKDSTGKFEMEGRAITKYALNGALHYAEAMLDYGGYDEAIAIGGNGYTKKNGELFTELSVYYISKKNNCIPKKVGEFADFSFLKSSNAAALSETLDLINLSEMEKDEIAKSVETTLEARIKSIHQRIYEDTSLKNYLSTNEKLYLFCGLIMAGLNLKGVASLALEDFKGNDNAEENDGYVISRRIKSFLKMKDCSEIQVSMITDLLDPIFRKELLWKPENGESKLKTLFLQVKRDIVPCLESNLHIDFMGKIMNSLSDWVSIENDKQNDVVLTPRYVARLMAKLAKTNRNSRVLDLTMGSAGFLAAAMDLMVKDATEKITDKEKLNEKLKSIREDQILGFEVLGNVYILAVLNMILLGGDLSNVVYGDSLKADVSDYEADVLLLNPPYSAPGKGLCFAEHGLSKMEKGFGCILIQENAGAGNGGYFAKEILKRNTLVASIHMSDIFCGKVSVQTAIYLFEAGRPHEEDDLVTFIDFSNDGYLRQARKKSSQAINLKDVDHAEERYAEIEARILGKKPKTEYYTEENGLLIKDTITLEGNDWVFNAHKNGNTESDKEIFKKTVAANLLWRINVA